MLLIATRLIGDVLLNTPLLRSMRRAWPSARIDVLVFKGTGSILQGNPDCTEVIELDAVPSKGSYRRLIARLFRRYDLAVTTQAGDRPYMLSVIASRRRVGLIGDASWKNAWKRAVAGCIQLDNVYTHTVVQNLELTKRLEIEPCFEVVPPFCTYAERTLDDLLPFDWRVEPFVVLHPFPSLIYKRWSDAGWRELVEYLRQSGLRVVLSGGPDLDEVGSCERLARLWPEWVTSLAGKTTFGTLSVLLAKAKCYVGPDTSTTHLAAACGTLTLALFGPSNPVKWGPWPQHCEAIPSPWVMHAYPWQKVGNVLLLQGDEECVPCFHEGCDRRRSSESRCLIGLASATVIAAIAHLLSSGVGA